MISTEENICIMISFCKTNNEIKPKQYLTCFLTIIRTSTIDIFTNLVNNLLKQSFTVVYTGIKKTFDFCHITNFKFLIQYGVDDNLVNWLNEFLNNRSQRVLINNTL